MKTNLHPFCALLLPVISLWALDLEVTAQDPTQKQVAGSSSDEFQVKLLEQQITDEGRGMSQVFLVSDKDEIFHAGKAFEIVKPAEVGDQSLAYTRIYFTGRSGKIDKGIIVLIADFDSDSPRFFIDQNNNLDFTDDGETKAKPCREGGVVLELIGEKPGSKFAINLIPFRGDETMTPEKCDQFEKMFQGFKDYMGGEFADSECWYFNRRLNNRTQSVEVDGQKVMIGMHDYDCDGLYTSEKDRLLVGEFEGDTISDALSDGAVNFAKGEIFLIGQNPYRIVDAAADGTSITIAKSDKMPDRLFVGSKVPSIKLVSFAGDTADIAELAQPGKLLVLDFWGQWCGPCLASIPSTIEFYEKWNEKVVFVGVHMGDHEVAKKLMEEKKIPFPQFESSDEAESALFIDAWPTYVVIDQTGAVVSFRSSLKEITKMLEQAK